MKVIVDTGYKFRGDRLMIEVNATEDSRMKESIELALAHYQEFMETMIPNWIERVS